MHCLKKLKKIYDEFYWKEGKKYKMLNYAL